MSSRFAGQPLLSELTELSPEAQRPYFRVLPNNYTLKQLGFGVFLDQREEQERIWIGFKDAQISSHDRWLYTRSAKETGASILVCPREQLGAVFRKASLTTTDLNRSLARRRDNVEDYNRLLNRMGEAPREGAWLVLYERVFNNTDIGLISLMPQHVDWQSMHNMLHHTLSWQESNNAVGLPRELVLRMHGLGPVIDYKRKEHFKEL